MPRESEDKIELINQQLKHWMPRHPSEINSVVAKSKKENQEITVAEPELKMSCALCGRVKPHCGV
jgi:hypothetical protein